MPKAQTQKPPADVAVSPAVLRNKGVPVTLYTLTNGQPPPQDDWVNGEQPTHQVFIRFDANAVAELEDAFEPFVCMVDITDEEPLLDDGSKPLLDDEGKPKTRTVIVDRQEMAFYGMDAFNQSMQRKVAKTVRKTLSIVLGVPETEAGRMMVPPLLAEYQNAIGVSWSIAQGVDPTDAVRVLEQSRAALAAKRAEMSERLGSQLQKMMEEDSDEMAGSPGPTGPPPGSPTD